ncbi:MAG: DEAD/DEAH box helicase [Pseudomonadota bacterium]
MNLHSHPELAQRLPVNARTGRGVTAVLGPTNTGKTHLAIERMLAQPSGMIGLPLRLLAREVYTRIKERVGPNNVALITGEEKIIPKGARYSVCTVEAMPPRTDVHFLAIDEVQLATSLDRGHVFTDRIMNLRGTHETMFLGAETLRPALEALLPGITVVSRPRMSELHYAGSKKITRLPRRSAIVAFSADEVYAIAELIRRQRGAAAVVLGSLSPRTRNAQVALYQSGDVDFLVATDAIGMGLNLDVDHVAFAQDVKFDGYARRRLKPAEFAQIAGRAGRHTRDGTFGVTGKTPPFEDELVERLEAHEFPPEKLLQWRNRDLHFDSLHNLLVSLDVPSTNPTLVRAPMATDQRALATIAGQDDIRERANTQARVELLWQVAQIPDYRRIAPANHADLLATIFRDVADQAHINEDWFAHQVRQTDVTEGDIDALSNRIAHIRTWTFVSHRGGWLRDNAHWQGETRAIENRLSDALHERLTKRFVDRRTSVLMKRLRENTMLEAEIAPSGAVTVEGHHVGELSGFRFKPDNTADGPDAKAANAAALKALAGEIEKRADRLSAAPNSDVVMDSDGTLRWLGEPVGRVVGSDDALKPRIIVLSGEQLTGTALDKVSARLERWLAYHIEMTAQPLKELVAAEGLEGTARGLAFRLVENFGIIDRREVAEDVRALDQNQRAALRRKGVRFGAYHIFVPALIKPAPAGLISLLWAVKNDALEAHGRAEVLAALGAGRTSMAVEEGISADIYRLAGFRVLGRKAVRVDILERLADFIRPAAQWRYQPPAKEEAAPVEEKPVAKAEATPETAEGETPKPVEAQQETKPANARPEGAWDGHGFMVTTAMLSILGATHEDMADVLRGLGYRAESLTEDQVRRKLAHWDGTPFEPKPVEEKPAAETAETENVAEPVGAEPVEEEIKRIEIWRQNRGDGNRHRGPRRDGQKRDGHQARGQGKPDHKQNRDQKHAQRKGGKPGGHQQKRDKKPANKPIDPDNPFAALMALKGDLGGSKKNK